MKITPLYLKYPWLYSKKPNIDTCKKILKIFDRWKILSFRTLLSDFAVPLQDHHLKNHGRPSISIHNTPCSYLIEFQSTPRTLWCFSVHVTQQQAAHLSWDHCQNNSYYKAQYCGHKGNEYVMNSLSCLSTGVHGSQGMWQDMQIATKLTHRGHRGCYM